MIPKEIGLYYAFIGTNLEMENGDGAKPTFRNDIHHQE